ncbi:lipocalin family protein [Pontibacter silvestris]|uniref:Lipocalin family protein n=1 Tax=Pontibacter silvestris TaxID=2305183 RepID=A0ABW4WT01_9BACT|nr:lipocalin family protein [Pontibacter silvestris]MCC9137690.1 lipocalin family protein [Pontibacter silvestris]
MLNLRLLSFFFLSLLTLTFISCSDDDNDEDTVEPSRVELLTAAIWNGNKITSENPIATPLLPSAESITIKFNEDGTYVATFEYDNTPYEVPGNWELTDDTIVLNLGLGDYMFREADITELTSTNLTLKGDVAVDFQGEELLVPIELYLVR